MCSKKVNRHIWLRLFSFSIPPKYERCFNQPALGVISRVNAVRPCLLLMPSLFCNACERERAAFGAGVQWLSPSWMSGGVIGNGPTCSFHFVVPPRSEATLLGGFVLFEQPFWIVFYMIALCFFFYPIQLWMTYIYSVFSLLCVKRSAELILFLFI